jgi:hypothetical protein
MGRKTTTGTTPASVEGQRTRRRATRNNRTKEDTSKEDDQSRSAVLPDGRPLDSLAPGDMLTVEQVLAVLPVQMDRRTWLRRVRQGHVPPPGARLSRKALFWRVDTIRALVRTMRGANGEGSQEP